MNYDSTIDVPGILVGHAENMQGLTGCSVVICKAGAMGGVDQRGGAPGTRETDALRPMHLVEEVHAVLLTGGSAFGLDAASGVMKYLEEQNIGFNSGFGKVPIVASAVLFDLGVGKSTVRPDLMMGYKACNNATDVNPAQGNVGVGIGATVGKVLGLKQAMKSGVGTACFKLGSGLKVGAIMAVNALGDIINPENGNILIGTRSLQKGPIKQGKGYYFADTLHMLNTTIGKAALRIASMQNTVIGVVATNAKLTKEEANKVAQMAQDGIALAIRPAHTMFDGDTIFTMATQKVKSNVNIVGAYASQAVAKAIINAARYSSSLANIPSIYEVPTNSQ